MKISELYAQKRWGLSFEVFPPKPDTPIETVFQTISQLANLRPGFISVTYGAGGSMQGRTVEIASRIKNEFKMEAMAHLTCVGQNSKDIDGILAQLQKAGIENILALRGDPPQGQPNFDFSRGQFKFARELIQYIRQKWSFCIVAAAYPEGHRACARISQDWDHLKEKVDTGVDVLITQLFYDNRQFYHFLENAEARRISCPIIPGIMPVFNSKQIKRILSMCGSAMPPDLLLLTEKYGDSAEDMRKAGIDYAIKQIQDLVNNGVKGIHLEPMNKPDLAQEILKGIGYL
jgi:methylenetetrahydrofolate reductase (NADPH)